MAHLNLDEQEQLTKLKYFWRDYGKYVIGFLLVVIIAYASSELWAYRSKANAKHAAIIYAKFTEAVSNNNTDNVYNIAKELEQKYPKTEYTTLASMWAAKIAFSNKALDQAVDYLQWVIDNAKDKSLVAVAEIRLADIYIDQKKPQQALDLMMKKTSPEFQALFYEKRGDLYIATNDKLKAVDAYKAALSTAEGNQELAQRIQMKLDILGN